MDRLHLAVCRKSVLRHYRSGRLGRTTPETAPVHPVPARKNSETKMIVELPERPRSFANEKARQERAPYIKQPHIRAINELIEEIGSTVGSPNLPYNDPLFGGVDAELLFVMKAPEADADPQKSGTRFLSFDNDDDGAANIFNACAQNGIARSRCIAWNICPFPIAGSRPTASDIRRAAPCTRRMISLLPDLKAVVLLGGPAHAGWNDGLLGAKRRSVTVFKGASPSPPGINQPKNRSSFEAAIHSAAIRLAE